MKVMKDNTEPRPDPGNSSPYAWVGDPIDDSEDMNKALSGEYDEESDDEQRTSRPD